MPLVRLETNRLYKLQPFGCSRPCLPPYALHSLSYLVSMQSRKKLIAIVVVALAVLSAGGFYLLKRPPGVLANAAAAALAADWDGVDRIVLVDSVADGLASEFVSRQIALYGEEVTRDEVEQARETLSSQMREALEEFVRGYQMDTVRAVAARPPLHPDSVFQIGPNEQPHIALRMELGKAKLAGFTRVWKRGDRMQVAAQVHYPELDTTFSVPVNLLRYDDGWRIVRIERLFDLGSRVAQRKEALLLRAHASEVGQLGAALSLEAPSANFRTSGGQWFRMKTVSSDVWVENVGGEPISKIALKIYVEGSPDEYVTARWEGHLEPGNTARAEYSDLTSGSGELQRVLEAENERLLRVRPYSITFVDGRTVEVPLDYMAWKAAQHHGVTK